MEKMNTKIILSSFKIATAVSCCWIIMVGDHIGGPLWMFIVFGLFSMHLSWMLWSIAYIGIIGLFIRSAFNPSRKIDLILFLSSGAAFIILFKRELLHTTHFRSDPFIWTSGIFAVLLFLTISYIYFFEE